MHYQGIIVKRHFTPISDELPNSKTKPVQICNQISDLYSEFSR
jgi:hypothetical protein